MSRKLYVGNLASTVTPEELRRRFAEWGAVCSVVVATDAVTRQPRGFAHVEMATPEGAAACIRQLNGVPVDGRPLWLKLREGLTIVSPVARVGGQACAIGSVVSTNYSDKTRRQLSSL